MRNRVIINTGVPYPLGATIQGECINFSYVLGDSKGVVVIYNKATGRELTKIDFPSSKQYGNIRCVSVSGLNKEDISYQIFLDEEPYEDLYAKKAVKIKKDGNILYRYEINIDNFVWGNSREPEIPFEEAVMYCLHVKGFTRHASSKVVNKGTFLGVVEKIPYLKELGVTTLEFMPVYQFPETIVQRTAGKQIVRDNYWGYTEGASYYVPNLNYAATKDSVCEMKTLIKNLHENGLEAVLQFYFPKDFPAMEIIQILRFWKMEYHVDGFHIKGENIPLLELARDPLFANTKLMYYYFPVEKIYGYGIEPAYKNLAAYNDEFMNIMRRFLKGDENMVSPAMLQLRQNPKQIAKINYFTNYYGLTLKDMVSYDKKHNEDNGENNMDGTDLNFSWNCGVEGPCRKRSVLNIRLSQMKNALLFLFLAQGTPLLYMGDEFGNSQNGNNNPYCQDNEISYLNWRNIDTNQEFFQFAKSMIAFRREHSVFRQKEECRMLDYLSCGYPDLSYHSNEAWKCDTSYYSRQLGFLYAGDYVKNEDGQKDSNFYVAVNMHWQSHQYALPMLAKYKSMTWELVLYSGADAGQVIIDNEREFVQIPERTIAVLKQVTKKVGKSK